MKTHPGWATTIATAKTIVEERNSRVETIAVDDEGLLTITASPENDVRLHGTAAMARSLSREICARCGEPGDPVKLPEGGQPTSRCFNCRPIGCTILPRPWRRDRDPARETADPNAPWDDHRHYETIEERYDEDRIQALMEHHYHAEDLRGSFVEGNAGGWNHIARAMLVLMLPHQCDGQPHPWRALQMKEKFGSFRVYYTGGGKFVHGIMEMVGAISRCTCSTCGRPGKITNMGSGLGEYWLPACQRCKERHESEKKNDDGTGVVKRIIENEHRFQGKHLDVESATALAIQKIDEQLSHRTDST